MKPPAFDYHQAHDVADAIGLLGDLTEQGREPKLIAGGQSLMPMMNFRLARPSDLIDIGRLREIAGMAEIEHTSSSLRLGALVTHRRVELAAVELGPGFDVLARAMHYVGHLPIRCRGTVGGSLVHGDATAEWCMLALLLDAVIVAEGPHGRREIPAKQMFRGFYTTAVEPDEVVTEVRFTRQAPRAALLEFARRAGDFATVAAAVSLETDGAVLRSGRVVLAGVGPVPARVPQAEEVLSGATPGPELFAACGRAAAEAIDPPSDAGGSAGYRRALTRTLVARGLNQAWERAGER